MTDDDPSFMPGKHTHTAPDAAAVPLSPLSLFSRLKNVLRTRDDDEDFSEQLNTIIESRDEAGSPLTEEEQRLIRAALKFDDITADEVAIARNEIVFLKNNFDFAGVLRTFIDTGYSRLPVCGRDLDDVLGFITLKDVVRFIGKEQDFRLEDALRQCPFLPGNVTINRVLQMMKAQKVQMAVVLDEYGGTSGLISLKDILEELVGDIDDENDTPDSEMVKKLPGGVYQIDPRMPIEDAEAFFGLNLRKAVDEDDFETIGGLVLHLAGRVPATGEKFHLEGMMTLEVLKADPRRLQSLLATPDKRPKHKIEP